MFLRFERRKPARNFAQTFASSVAISLSLMTVVLGQQNAVKPKSTQIPTTCIKVLPDGKVLAGSDLGLTLLDKDGLASLKSIKPDIEKCYGIAISPNGSRVAVSGGIPGELGCVEVYSISDWKRLTQFQGFDDICNSTTWISNDRLVGCSVTGNCSIIIVDSKSDSTPAVFNVHSKSILNIAALRFGQVVTCSKDNSIRVWSLDKPSKPRILNNHVDIVNAVAARPVVSNGTAKVNNRLEMMASVSDDGTLRFWQPTIGRMMRFVRLESIPTCLDWTKDGTVAIAGCRDGSLQFVDPATATLVKRIPGKGWINDLSISPDGQRVYLAGEHGVSFVDISEINQDLEKQE